MTAPVELDGQLSGAMVTLCQWNPRYVLYAKAHGRSPEEMSAYDEARFPGGCMGGFMSWINDAWCAFETANPEAKGCRLCYTDEFDQWLSARVLNANRRMALDYETMVRGPLTEWGFFMLWELSAQYKMPCLRKCVVQEGAWDIPLSDQCYTEDCPLPVSFGGIW